jgi:hypothetical protein
MEKLGAITQPRFAATAARRTAGSDASHPVVPHTTAIPRLSSAMTLSLAASGRVNSKATLTPRHEAESIARTARSFLTLRSTMTMQAWPRTVAASSIARPIFP